MSYQKYTINKVVRSAFEPTSKDCVWLQTINGKPVFKVYVNGEWKPLGYKEDSSASSSEAVVPGGDAQHNTDVDLSGYVTTIALEETLSDYVSSTSLSSELLRYVSVQAYNQQMTNIMGQLMSVNNEISRLVTKSSLESEVVNTPNAIKSSAVYQMKGALESAISDKQDTLTPGDNVTITDNVISVEADSQLSNTSTKPIQNKTVYTELDKKQDKLQAGSGISIQGGVISAPNGGGGSAENTNVLGVYTGGDFYKWEYNENAGTWGRSDTPTTLTQDKIYIDIDTNMVYRYNGTDLERLYDNSMVPMTAVSVNGAHSMSIDANTFYKFVGTLTSLTLTLNPVSDAQLPMYSGKFTVSGDNFSFSAVVDGTTLLGQIPFVSGATYEFYIVDNVLSFTILGDGSNASDSVNLITLALNHGDFSNALSQSGLAGSAYFQYLLETQDGDGNTVKKMIWHVGNNVFIDAFGSIISE